MMIVAMRSLLTGPINT